MKSLHLSSICGPKGRFQLWPLIPPALGRARLQDANFKFRIRQERRWRSLASLESIAPQSGAWFFLPQKPADHLATIGEAF